jgi:hypothetical protein
VDDDDTLWKPRPVAGQFEAFHRALDSTMFACERLGAAIRLRDLEGAKSAASDAVESWLTLRRALRRLEFTVVDTGQCLQTARFATKAYRRALGDLLDRAHAQLAAPSLHQLLAQLRLSLAIANDECARPASKESADDPASDA